MITQSFEKQLLIEKMTEELVSSINILSKDLPENPIYRLSDKLMNTVSSIPKYIAMGISNECKRLDKIRYYMTANTALEDCKNYLTLVETLKYGNTEDIIEKINDVNTLLAIDCPYITGAICKS